MFSTMPGEGFRAITSTVNLLGYGNGIGMFLYLTNQTAGTQFGAVIPVTAVPEPSTWVTGLAGIACAALAARRWRAA